MKLTPEIRHTYIEIIKEVYGDSKNDFIVKLLTKAGIDKKYLYQLITDHTLTKTELNYINKFLRISSDNLIKK